VIAEPGCDSLMKLMEGGDSCTVTPFRVCILQQMVVGVVMEARWAVHAEMNT
jgi:hypothetical protein